LLPLDLDSQLQVLNGALRLPLKVFQQRQVIRALDLAFDVLERLTLGQSQFCCQSSQPITLAQGNHLVQFDKAALCWIEVSSRAAA